MASSCFFSKGYANLYYLGLKKVNSESQKFVNRKVTENKTIHIFLLKKTDRSRKPLKWKVIVPWIAWGIFEDWTTTIEKPKVTHFSMKESQNLF